MEQKIQLKHPAGKKAINMDKEKYDLMKKAVLSCLKKEGDSTHKEMLKAITENFKKNKTKFVGSVEWHMEWLKLDLEAREEIKRIVDTTPNKFKLA
jgi:RNA:NAD 2'-phosphotransferase (TPT1/KptA family)